MVVRITVLLFLGIAIVFILRFVNQFIQTKPIAGPTIASVYYGAYVDGAPRNIVYLATFESHSGKGVAILNWYQGWGVTDGTQNFQPSWMGSVRNHGSIPMITWEPWDYTKGLNQPEYSLRSIINGNLDTYITKWAQDSKTWGHPYFLRFAHEMNATNYPWSEKVNGNSPGEYILAWKHVRDIFTSVGANNVTWVWSPNVEYTGTIPLGDLYPGDNYVDWLGMDGYNGGTSLPWGGWLTFPQIFGPTYNNLVALAPNKPIMVSETASAESGGIKADWIKDTYQLQIPTNYPKVKAILWFNQNNSWEVDWRIESSLASQNSFATYIASAYYASNQYANLNTSPISVPEHAITPTPQISPTVVSDTTAPKVSIVSPADGSLTSNKVYISAVATDNVRVAKVDFYIDNKYKTSDLTPDYVYNWNTNKETKGAHFIKAVAYDAANNSASSQITVYK